MTQPPQFPYGGQAYGSPYPQQPLAPASRTMAGWALALSILGCIPLAIFVAAGLAIAVLVRSKDGRDHGKGMAIAALVIAGVWLLVLGGLVGFGVVQGLREGVDADRNDQGQVTEPTDISVQNLRVGDCFDDPALLGAATDDTAEALTARVMPCSDAHHFEVYHVFKLTNEDYPGEAEVTRLANEGCFSAYQSYVGKPARQSLLDVYYYYPQKRTWSLLGDRSVQCIIASPEGLVTGSLENSRR